MKNFTSLFALLSILAGSTAVQAATKEQWRDRAIYQIVTDRFSKSTQNINNVDNCPPTGGFCGGNWKSIIDKLDYISDLGYSAIWISPIQQNLDVDTPYGLPYHGYWVDNPTKLNSRFGSEQDLKDLIDAAHSRGMYVMVDVVLNHIATKGAQATVQEMLDADPMMGYRNVADYHPYCKMDYNVFEQVRNCSLGDSKVPLVDVNSESSTVRATLNDWISSTISHYGIDGLRLDAAKHMPPDALKEFCTASGVMCMGEIFTSVAQDLVPYVNGNIDSAHGFPIYNGIKTAFQSGMNVQGLVNKITESQQFINDPSVLGTFISNHDVSRWFAVNADLDLAQNAMTALHMIEGIPTMFYGEEQEIAYGMDDPDTRFAMWSTVGGLGTTNYPTDKPTFQLIKRLNAIRSYLYKGDGFALAESKLLTKAGSKTEAGLKRGNMVYVLNNRGTSGSGGSVSVPGTGFSGTAVDMLTCTQVQVSADGAITVNYPSGGKAFVFLSLADAAASGICPDLAGAAASSSAVSTAATSQISVAASTPVSVTDSIPTSVTATASMNASSAAASSVVNAPATDATSKGPTVPTVTGGLAASDIATATASTGAIGLPVGTCRLKTTHRSRKRRSE